MGYLEHTEEREPSEASLKATALMVAANTPYTEEDDDGRCSECANGTCPDCVDRFIREFAAIEGSAAEWLQSNGCEPVIDPMTGDETVNEVLRDMASAYSRGQVWFEKRNFLSVMQKFSAQATKARAAE